ncbi:unnamed protein product [Withania somnifera]
MSDGKDDPNLFIIDEIYEFSAPRFYDFIDGETEEDMRKAELWFEITSSYAPSPCMPRIKTGRLVQVEIPCVLTEGEKLQSNTRPAAKVLSSEVVEEMTPDENKPAAKVLSSEVKKEVTPNENKPAAKVLSSEVKEEVAPNENKPADKVLSSEVKKAVTPTENKPAAKVLSSEVKEEVTPSDEIAVELNGILPNPESFEKQPTSQETCTPRPPPTMCEKKIEPRKTDSNNQKTQKKISSTLKNRSALKSKTLPEKSANPASMRKQEIMRRAVGTPNFGQENQAIKKQKLESGKAKQILDVKPQNLPHKTKPGTNGSTFSSAAKTRKEERKMYVREPPQFISTAEMMKKFQCSTREMSLSYLSSSTSHRKPNKLTLTAPKEPEFVTAQRVRPTTVKSSSELEEEMMTKIPKFKARPLNRKILEAPNLPTLPKSTPQLPEFKEFHLSTMARANQNVETSSVLSMESTQSHQWKPHLTAPRSPVLKTSLRARLPQIKSSEELEKEALEKIPKFKARPFNKKIFESKGDLGMFCNTKKQVTVPEEFHFATDERIPLPANVTDLFDKLSLNSEPRNEKTALRSTRPNPFHLYTEERGEEKERKMFTELVQKQIEEERSRVPKATPYPYTTDYPVIPPKPEPKHCTKPEPFQLESLVRHEREMQRELEERQRLEKEEEMMRTFKAQPVLVEDPIPVPEKVRKPLTQVQEFNLHVDHRATDRAEFDKKIKEKEMMYQKYREEAEAARTVCIFSCAYS